MRNDGLKNIGKILLALAVFVFSHQALVQADDVKAAVDQLLNRPQVTGDEYPIRLTQLGKPAVPVLIEKLRTYPHPMVIVEALGMISDPRATLPLTGLLAQVSNDPWQARTVIAALREIGDSRAEPKLLELVHDEKAVPTVRLVAAAAMARIGSAQVKEEVRHLIMKVDSPISIAYRENPPCISDCDTVDLDWCQAYYEVGTDEAVQSLSECLDHAVYGNSQSYLINLFAKNPSPTIIESLFRFAENSQTEPPYRLDAARVLMRQKESRRDRLVGILYSVRDSIPPDGNDEGWGIHRSDVNALIDQVNASWKQSQNR